MTQLEEAKLVVEGLRKEYGTNGKTDREPPNVDGKRAILEMRSAEDSEGPTFWRENEWPGYYLKWKAIQHVLEHYPEQFEIIQKGKLYLIKGDTLWDLRFNAAGEHWATVPIVSYTNLEWILDDYNEYGLLVFNAKTNYDDTGDFLLWHEALKGDPSEFIEERVAEGRYAWNRKVRFMIIAVHAFYFAKSDFENDSSKHWIGEHFQIKARQADGGERGGKPEIHIFNVPDHCHIGAINFNYDADDWPWD